MLFINVRGSSCVSQRLFIPPHRLECLEALSAQRCFADGPFALLSHKPTALPVAKFLQFPIFGGGGAEFFERIYDTKINLGVTLAITVQPVRNSDFSLAELRSEIDHLLP